MTIFEFLSVAASIVLALGLGKLISSIPYVFDAHKRDWLDALAFVTLIAGQFLAWWRAGLFLCDQKLESLFRAEKTAALGLPL